MMPTDENILGFGNAWYVAAMENAKVVHLDTGESLQLITPPFFLITKLDAFRGRGNNDYQMSHDMEDVIAVIDGRPELVADLKSTAPQLRGEIAIRIRELLGEPAFVQSIPGHMPGDPASQQRVPRILDTLRQIAEINT
ncbi:MAG: hypothetical protein RLN96_12415 [Pseudomonadales bacterium]